MPGLAGRAAAALDDRLLAAHAAGDKRLLARLYAEAAGMAEAAGQAERAAFYLTHAYIWALDAGDARAGALHAELKARGRES